MPDAEGSRVGFPQHPALSPDGEHVVFSWAGDLWLTSADGGRATRLTSHPAYEGRAVFSPNGNTIAFESNRSGARNVYTLGLAEVDGELVAAAIRPVTRADRSATLSGFSDDGEMIYFTARRAPGIYRMPEMYQVGVDGGPVTPLTDAYGREPRATADGDAVLFSRGYWNWERPAYRGPGALNIWRMSTNDGSFDQVTFGDHNDANAFGLPDGSIVFISSRDGQNNVYHLKAGADDRERRAVRQLTSFKPEDVATIAHGVRDLNVSADGSTAVFAMWDTLYTLDLDRRRAEPKPLELHASVDADELDYDRIDLDRQVSEAAMSPDGKTMAVVARGEVFVRSTDEDRPTRRVTHTSAREQGLAWSPDGATLYFTSDEPGHAILRAAEVSLARIDLKPEDDESDDSESDDDDANDDADDAEAADDNDEPKPGAHRIAAADPSDFPGTKAEPKTDTPDDDADKGKKDDDKDDEDKADAGERWAGALRFEIRDVLQMDGPLSSPVISPNGKHILLTHGRGDLVITDPEGDDARVLFEHWSSPEAVWAPDSRHIVFSKPDLDFNSDIWLLDTKSDDAEAVNITRHPDFDYAPRLSADGKVLYFLSDRDGQNWSFDVYAVMLDRELEGLRDYELAEYFTEAGKAAKKRKPIKPEGSKSEGKKADAKKDTGVEYAVDADDAYLRIRRVFNATGSVGNLSATPAGDRVAFTTSIDGTNALYSVKYDGSERKTVHRGGASGVAPSLTGSKLVYVSGGQARSAPPAGGKSQTYAIDAPVVIDIEQQQRQKFLEAAQALGDGFYHPTLKGLDWNALSDRYLELAMKTRTTTGFNRVGNMLFGELNGSHLGMFGGPSGFRGDAPATGYLGIDASPTEGGYQVNAVLAGGPADQETSQLFEGDVILAVDDLRFRENGAPAMDLFDALADTRGRETLLEVRRKDNEETDFVIITPTSPGAENNLRYDREVEHRRQMVRELSDGKLGYLHIRSMGEPSVRDFERDLYAAAEGKLGLVIDVRDNGGGWTTDILLASLTAPAHAYTIPRGAETTDVSALNYPRDRRLIYAYQRPISVLINENSFSNAEIFAHSIKTTGRGRLVGTQTFGGVISTGGQSLIDGTFIRMP
ncbi:MAG: S41 family peptidase, partial [Planctomycetota bacterium]